MGSSENAPNRTGRSTGPHAFEMGAWVSRAPFERLLHLEIVEAAGGRATLTMPFLLDFAQGAGLMHGGALVSLADTAAVMAIKSLVPPGTHFATISVRAEFLYPVRQGTVTARARIAGREGRLLHGEATVTNDDDRPVLRFSATFKLARDAVTSGITYREPPDAG